MKDPVFAIAHAYERLVWRPLKAAAHRGVRLFQAIERSAHRTLTALDPYPSASVLHDAQQGRLPREWRT